jgi:hypothetical protein
MLLLDYLGISFTQSEDEYFHVFFGYLYFLLL